MHPMHILWPKNDKLEGDTTSLYPSQIGDKAIWKSFDPCLQKS